MSWKHQNSVPQAFPVFHKSFKKTEPKNMFSHRPTYKGDRAIAQAVSRRFPTAAARALTRVSICGICGEQSWAGAAFLRVLRFPLPIFIPPITPQSPSSIIWGWYNRAIVTAVPSGLSLTPLRIIIIMHTKAQEWEYGIWLNVQYMNTLLTAALSFYMFGLYLSCIWLYYRGGGERGHAVQHTHGNLSPLQF
jgi:hypothetical protein